VRPVGSPQHALGIGFEQRFCKRDGVGVRERLRGNAIGSGQLDPALAALDQTQHRPVAGVVQAFIGFHVTQVPEHDVRREARELAIEVGELVGVHEEFHVPAVGFDSLRHARERLDRDHPFAFRDVDHVHAHAAHPGRVKALELAVRYVAVHNRDAAAARGAELRHRVQHDGVVGAVHARLNEHRAFDAERREHRAVIG
jgi:hypothetical protein